MNGIKECVVKNEVDVNSNPTGGSVTGVGLNINWQDGPLGRGEERIEPNGAFVETVISACVERLEFYQESKFNCGTSEEAIASLNNALASLESRTRDREQRGVEGEHKE